MEDKLTKTEISNIRLSCLFEASRLKQNQLTATEFENKSVIEVAKELETYLMGDL